jgi:hypothetical protein
MHDPEALIVSSISTIELDSNPLDSELDKFKKWRCIMFKDAAKHLAEYRSYDYPMEPKT